MGEVTNGWGQSEGLWKGRSILWWLRGGWSARWFRAKTKDYRSPGLTGDVIGEGRVRGEEHAERAGVRGVRGKEEACSYSWRKMIIWHKSIRSGGSEDLARRYEDTFFPLETTRNVNWRLYWHCKFNMLTARADGMISYAQYRTRSTKTTKTLLIWIYIFEFFDHHTITHCYTKNRLFDRWYNPAPKLAPMTPWYILVFTKNHQWNPSPLFACFPKTPLPCSQKYLVLIILARPNSVAIRCVGCHGISTGIQTHKANDATQKNQYQIHEGQSNFLGTSGACAPVDVEPTDTRKTVREPRSKESRDETEEIREDWNRLGNDPGDSPWSNCESDPRSSCNPTSAVQVFRSGENTEVDVFDSDVSKDNSCDDDCWQCNSPCDFTDDWSVAVKGWTSDILAGISIDDDSCDEVKRDVDGLEENERLGEFLGVAEFSNEADPGNVTTICKDNVGNAVESRWEIRRVSSLHGSGGCSWWNGQCDHGEHDSGKDTGEGYEIC